LVCSDSIIPHEEAFYNRPGTGEKS
jgi:hypothetical protein